MTVVPPVTLDSHLIRADEMLLCLLHETLEFLFLKCPGVLEQQRCNLAAIPGLLQCLGN